MTTQPARGWRRVLGALCLLQAALILVQATLAGHFLSGNSATIVAHETVGTSVITWVALLQVATAVLLWRPGRGPVWPMPASAVLFGLVVLQLGWGFESRLALHVPVGVALLGSQLLVFALLQRTQPLLGRARPGRPWSGKRPVADRQHGPDQSRGRADPGADDRIARS